MSSPTPRSAAACSASTVRGRSSRSTLLTTTTTGTPLPASSEAMNLSPGPARSSPLSTSSAASDSSSSRSTRRCMRSVSASRGRCTPGRSTSTSCHSGVVATPRIARRVVWGLSETIATLRPTIALTSVDLPTFGRPASATKPDRLMAPPGAGFRGRSPRQQLALQGEHLAVVGLVVHPGEVQNPVDDRLAHVARVLDGDHDVAELAHGGRAGDLAGLVDREREHVGRRVAPAVVAVELPDALTSDELHREVAVLDARRGERDR